MSGLINSAGSKSGIIGMADPTPSVFMYMRAPQTSWASSQAHTKINLDTVLYNNFGNFDSTNKRWIPMVAGDYMAWLVVAGHNVPNTVMGTGQIYKNGTGGTQIAAYRHNGNFLSEQLTYYAYGGVAMNGSTDYFEAWCNFNGNVSQINDGIASTHLQILRVG